MQRSTFRVLFYIKRTKLLKSGDAPVYMKITIDGKSSETSLKRGIKPQLWDTNRNKAKGNSKKVHALNEYLNSCQGQVYTHHQKLQESGKHIDAKTLRDLFLGRGISEKSLISSFQKHNDQIESLVGKEYSPLTHQRYESALKHIKSYCKNELNIQDINLKNVDFQFIKGFEFYLKTEKSCQHNSAMKHIKALKKIINLALSHGWIKKDPFANYKITQKKVERECLTEHEIQDLLNKEFSIERIEIVRDLFIFQCFTGLAYKDLKALNIDHIQIGMDGGQWIYIKRGKTGTPCHIPLLPIAKSIMEKYSNHSCRSIDKKLLPVPSNQKMNAYLKEVADLCGIKKQLHTHLARHTYATTVTLSNGVPIETVSKLLGHKKLQTTQVYAKVLDSKISDDIQGIQKKFAY